MASPWKLVRTLNVSGLADDPDWVANAAQPSYTFTVPQVNGQVAGGMKLAWDMLTSAGNPVAPTGTYDYRLVELVDPSKPGSLNYTGAAVTGAAFGSLVYLASQPGDGASYALRVYTVAGLPGTAVSLRLWVKGAVV